jgi:hypothetical protein
MMQFASCSNWRQGGFITSWVPFALYELKQYL